MKALPMRNRARNTNLPLFEWANQQAALDKPRTIMGRRLQEQTGMSSSLCDAYALFQNPNAMEVL